MSGVVVNKVTIKPKRGRCRPPLCQLSDFHKLLALAGAVDVGTHRTLRIGNHLLQVCNKGARIGSTEGVLLVAAGELDAHLITLHAQVRDGGAVDLEVTHDVLIIKIVGLGTQCASRERGT